MKTLSQLFLCSILLLRLSGCQSIWSQPLPKTEIVYQSDDFNQSSIGFVDSNGLNATLYPGNAHLIRPVWSLDGKTIFGLARFNPPVLVLGTPTHWDTHGKQRACQQWFDFGQIEEIKLADGSRQTLEGVMNYYKR